MPPQNPVPGRHVDGFAGEPVDEIETCLQRGRPFGDPHWQLKTAKERALESSLNPRKSPKDADKHPQSQ